MPATDKPLLLLLFGGPSAEHDVSCMSARQVQRAVDRSRFDLRLIGITKEGSWLTGEEAERLLHGVTPDSPASPSRSTTVLRAIADQDRTMVAFPLLHGPFGEDGTIQGLLETLSIPYVGTGVLGSAVCMDKAVAKAVAASHGISQPRYVVVQSKPDGTRHLPPEMDALGWPRFVKPSNQGSSIGISRVSCIEEQPTAIEYAASLSSTVIIEEAVSGREIECAVLGNGPYQVACPGEVICGDGGWYDTRLKYPDGEEVARQVTIAPSADLAEDLELQIRAFAIRVAEVYRVRGLARVDLFLTPTGELLLNEVNTMPGFTSSSMYPMMWQASGLDYPSLISRLVELAIEGRPSRV